MTAAERDVSRTTAVPRMKPTEYVSAVANQIAGGEKVSNRLAVLVLSAIAEKADWKAWTWGEHSWRSAETIAAEIGYTDRAVRYAYKVLVAGGWLSIDPRPGRTNVFTVLAPIDPPAPAPTPLWTRSGRRVRNLALVVDKPGDNSPPRGAAARSVISLGGETVAADLVPPPTEHPPVGPPVARKSNSDGADAPAHAAPAAPRGGEASSGAAPPSPAGFVEEPHRRMRDVSLGAEPAAPSLDGTAVAPSGPDAAEREPAKLSRRLALRRRCPKCCAQPGESCNGARGQLRKAMHAERRAPDWITPAARAGVWRMPRSPDEPAF